MRRVESATKCSPSRPRATRFSQPSAVRRRTRSLYSTPSWTACGGSSAPATSRCSSSRKSSTSPPRSRTLRTGESRRLPPLPRVLPPAHRLGRLHRQALRSGKVSQIAPIIGNPKATPQAVEAREGIRLQRDARRAARARRQGDRRDRHHARPEAEALRRTGARALQGLRRAGRDRHRERACSTRPRRRSSARPRPARSCA